MIPMKLSHYFVKNRSEQSVTTNLKKKKTEHARWFFFDLTWSWIVRVLCFCWRGRGLKRKFPLSSSNDLYFSFKESITVIAIGTSRRPLICCRKVQFKDLRDDNQKICDCIMTITECLIDLMPVYRNPYQQHYLVPFDHIDYIITHEASLLIRLQRSSKHSNHEQTEIDDDWEFDLSLTFANAVIVQNLAAIMLMSNFVRLKRLGLLQSLRWLRLMSVVMKPNTDLIYQTEISDSKENELKKTFFLFEETDW